MRIRLMALLSIGLASALPAAAQYYAQTNLVSDEPGKAAHVDTHLVNAWGLVAGPTTPWWVANNGTLTSTLYNATGTARTRVAATIAAIVSSVLADVAVRASVRAVSRSVATPP